jgi:ribosomal protein L7/L12
VKGWTAKQVEVKGEHGFQPISFIKLMRETSVRKLSLAEAKALVDEMINGHPFTVEFGSEDEAAHFVIVAENLGAIVSRS